VVEPLIALLKKRPDAKIVGPRLLNPDGTLQSSTHGYPNIAKECLRLFPGILSRLKHPTLAKIIWSPLQTKLKINLFSRFESYVGEIQEVDELTGACLLMEKTVFLELGGFDPRYFMYLEEADLCFRVRMNGDKILYFPFVEVIHEIHGSSARMDSKEHISLYCERYRSLVYFYRKNKGRLQTLLLRASLSLILWIRMLLTVLPAAVHLPLRKSFCKDLACLKSIIKPDEGV
jgi:GT2 family glycosyltransferase